jgi:hypothetical protein
VNVATVRKLKSGDKPVLHDIGKAHESESLSPHSTSSAGDCVPQKPLKTTETGDGLVFPSGTETQISGMTLTKFFREKRCPSTALTGMP